MSRPSNTESLAIRHAPYIKELHEFFKSSGLRFGSPKDLQPLVESLSTRGNIHDDMASMVRSIIYRERKAIPRTELLELIVVAIGGPHIDQSAQQIHEPVRQLLAFVGEVMHSLRKNSFLDEPAETDPEQSLEPPAADLYEDVARRVEDSPSTHRIGELTAEDVEEDWATVEPRSDHATPLAAAYPLPRHVPMPFQEPQPGTELDPFPASSHDPVIPPGSALTVAPAPLVSPSPRRSLWLVGVCLLLLLCCMGLFWRSQSLARLVQSKKVDQSSATSFSASALTAPNPIPQTLSAAPASNVSPERASTSASLLPSQALPSQISVGAPTRSTLPNSPDSPAQAPAIPNSANSRPVPSRPGRAALRPAPSIPARSASPAAASTSAPTNSFLVSSGVMSGNLISSPTPSYPKMAKMTGVEGQVILQAVVSRNGTVVATHVLDGHHMLRGAAAHAVMRWRYKPYLVNGKPADIATIVIVDFHLPH